MATKPYFRLSVSAIVAFISYAAWAYYANSLVSDDQAILFKSALVQGTYSGAVTLVFTLIIEVSFSKFANKHFGIGRKLDAQNVEAKSHQWCISGVIISPLPALLFQTIFVIAVNVFFETPNLWLTVAPSIIFSAIYGYLYTFALARKS